MLFVVSVVNYTQMAKEVIKQLLNHYASLNVAELPAESNTSFSLVSEMIPEQEEFGGDVKFSFNPLLQTSTMKNALKKKS